MNCKIKSTKQKQLAMEKYRTKRMISKICDSGHGPCKFEVWPLCDLQVLVLQATGDSPPVLMELWSCPASKLQVANQC